MRQWRRGGKPLVMIIMSRTLDFKFLFFFVREAPSSVNFFGNDFRFSFRVHILTPRGLYRWHGTHKYNRVDSARMEKLRHD